METKSITNNRIFRKEIRNKKSSLLPNKSVTKNYSLIKIKIRQEFYNRSEIIMIVSDSILRNIQKH